MNRELLNVIEQIAKERGISRETLISTLESALLSAAKKRYGSIQDMEITIDPKTGAIDARRIIDGEPVPNVDLKDLGRIAAQTAKQVIIQKVREAERAVIYNEFKDKVGQVINCVVLRQERENYIVDLGTTEGILPQREQMPREVYKRSDRFRAYIIDVKTSSKGPQIVLSRTHPSFVAKLFEMEVPEIYEGIVEIKGVVREPGDRTKIAAYSKDPSVDPVGACVGMKGSRVQAIVRELKGEKIDIIPWTDDPNILIAKSLSPAIVEKVGINEEEKSALVVVSDQQLSLAIGKKGQNVRLAVKLTGWDIDIMSESEYEKVRKEELEKEVSAAISEESAETNDNNIQFQR